VWVGGITAKEYASISGVRNNYPNQSRATQGEFAPGSTFKPVTLSAAVMAGYPLGGTYPCPSSYTVGGRSFSNYESEAFGQISLKKAIEVSCDTVFYKLAYEMWVRDGGIRPKARPADHLTRMAQGFGLGKETGLDLPEESGGRIADRAWKQEFWERTRMVNCAKGRSGYPDIAKKDPERAAYLKLLAQENCLEGNQYRAGDAVNFSIGQGDTTTTPLQMARLYAAIANGGTLWVPTIAKAVVSPDGRVVRQIKPRSAGRLPVRPDIIRFLQNALRSVPENGTARFPFAEWPLDKIPMAAKTGTAEVYGKQSTSWFATYGPATAPQYSVVMMVSQGGTGSGVSGPSVEKIYEALLGVKNRKVVPSAALLPSPPRTLPVIKADGTIVVPKDSAPAAPVPPKGVAAATTPSASTTRSAAGRKPG
jgi:penicillin-binding protein 2